MKQKLDLDGAHNLLHKNMQNINLRRHCYAVSVVMRGLYRHLKENGKLDSSLENLSEEDWGVVGVLHDADYELTKECPEKHTVMLMDWLMENYVHHNILEAYSYHNTKVTNLRETQTYLEM